MLILLTWIWVMGIKIATAENMILGSLHKYGEQKLEQGHKIYEALWMCEWCMPSIHSIVGYAFAFAIELIPFHFEWRLVFMYPMVVMGASLLSGMTWLLYLTLNKVHDRNDIQGQYYDKMEQLSFFELKERRQSHRRNTTKN